MRRGSADDWQSRTRLQLRGGRKAQREMLASSGNIGVHAAITEDARRVSPSQTANHQCTSLQFEPLT